MFRFSLLALALFTASAFVSGHDRYILPSHTILSGDAQSVSMISSISNDIFHADRPFGDNGRGVVPETLKGFFSTLSTEIIIPDGSLLKTNIWQAFARFSAADLKLSQSGTYRISLVQTDSLMASFKKADGSPGRAFGKVLNIPKGASDVKRYLTQSRVETFVTLNEPDSKAFRPTGKGLELGGETHPNDLFTGEEAHFQLYYNGQRLKSPVQLSFSKEDTRHRNQRNPIKIQTTETGAFKITFEEAGFYLMQAEAEFPGIPEKNIDKQFATLFVTLEIFPE